MRLPRGVRLRRGRAAGPGGARRRRPDRREPRARRRDDGTPHRRPETRSPVPPERPRVPAPGRDRASGRGRGEARGRRSGPGHGARGDGAARLRRRPERRALVRRARRVRPDPRVAPQPQGQSGNVSRSPHGLPLDAQDEAGRPITARGRVSLLLRPHRVRVRAQRSPDGAGRRLLRGRQGRQVHGVRRALQEPGGDQGRGGPAPGAARGRSGARAATPV